LSFSTIRVKFSFVPLCLRGYTFVMEVRNAKISDAEAVYSLINYYAERDKMLFRSLADIYENLQSFIVAEVDGRVVGCCALQIIWSDLVEIQSLAVDEANKNKGVGTMLVKAAIEKTRQLGLPRIFALTLDPGFFERLDFKKIEMDALPMKVWRDCAKCPKQQNCDEIAVLKRVS
jgi:amino-acid N-acetyltransferase